MKQNELLSRVERLVIAHERETGKAASPGHIQSLLAQEGWEDTLEHVADAIGVVYSLVPICPACGWAYTGYPAISRRDNETEICSECGTQEALDDFRRAMEQ